MPYCSQCKSPYSQGERFCPADGGAILVDDADADADPLIGKTIAGRYFVKRQVARGGMGVVYEAEHVGLDKRIALKFILDKLTEDRDVVMRFHREARTASRIGHDNIVDIFDIGETDDGRHFIAMEFLDGADLCEVLRREGPLAPARALRIISQVLSGLGAAHAAGVVHRDMKPENVFLTRSPTRGDDFVKIMDFGISKFLAVRDARVRLTETGVVIGTPVYMAPEQAQGLAEIDHRVDLYAAGAMLFEMLTGRPPFVSDSYVGLITQHLQEPPPHLSALRPELSLALDQCVQRALAKSPALRYASADEFARALPAPSQLIAAPTAARGRRWAPLIVVGVALVLAAGGIAGALAMRDGGEAKATPPRPAKAAEATHAARTPAPTPPSPDSSEPAVRSVLEIDSSPAGATVAIDGEIVGVTPVAHTIAAGTHRVRIELAGHEPVDVERQVRSGFTETFFAALAPAGSGRKASVRSAGSSRQRPRDDSPASPAPADSELAAPYDDDPPPVKPPAEPGAGPKAKATPTGSKPNPYLDR